MKREVSQQIRYDQEVDANGEAPGAFAQRHFLPRWFWYLIHVDAKKPYKSPTWTTLLSLKGEPILAARELVFTHCQLLVEVHSRKERVESTRNNTDTDFSLSGEKLWLRRARRLLTKPEILREVLAAVIVMLSQQLCGINLLIIYSSSLFCSAGRAPSDVASSRAPLWFSWGIGLTNVVFALPTYFLIDRRGRKWLLMVTLPVLACLLGIVSAGFNIPNEQPGLRNPLIAVFTYLFTAVYSFGVGPVPFTYSAEIFPLEQRIVGMSLAVSVNLLGLGLLIFFAPFADEQATLLAAFAGLNALAFVLVWLFVPEVAGAAISDSSSAVTHLNLDQLSQIFRLKTWTHVRYQLSTAPRNLWMQLRSKFNEQEEEHLTFFDWAERKEADEADRTR